MTTDEASPECVYTLDEAAAHLRLTNRGVAKLARRLGACMIRGRDFLFTDRDLETIMQHMRLPPSEPRRSVVPLPLSDYQLRESLRETFMWASPKPPTKSDARELAILKWLADQTTPKTYEDIERAGPATISKMLERSFVTHCGVDAKGLTRVRIAAAGREELKLAEKWRLKHAEWRQRTGR